MYINSYTILHMNSCSIQELYKYFLRKFEIKLDSKIIKSGQLRLITNKEYFIVFSYNDMLGKIKTIDIPNPFNIYKQGDVFVLDYTIDTLCNIKNDMLNKLKLSILSLKMDNTHMFFNKKIYLTFH